MRVKLELHQGAPLRRRYPAAGTLAKLSTRAKLASGLRLLTAHKILISAALGLALLLTIRSAVLYTTRHLPLDAGFAIGSLGLAFALGWYLRKLRRM